jgi:hypothetical protein
LLVVAVLIQHAFQPVFTGISSFFLESAQKIALVEGLDECLGPERYRARVPSFEPLNAKKLERPAACSEPGIVYTPQCFGILTWWSHVLV